MKKIQLCILCSLTALLLSSCATSKNNSPKISGLDRLPPLNELYVILDSIVNEGWQLYYSERVNWIATDLFFENHDMNDVGGNISYKPNDTVWTVVYFDKNLKNCIYQYSYNISANKQEISDNIRPITPEEVAELDKKEKILNRAINTYGDSLYFASQTFGSPNVDIVRINDNLTRVYLLQGTIIEDMIPFGNDYSIDFDKNLNPIAFRKYHKSLIPTKTKTEDGGKVKQIMHSHLKNNPFITPTDICNFLLYRPDDMDYFFVYSTAYKCKFAYSFDSNKIMTVMD